MEGVLWEGSVNFAACGGASTILLNYAASQRRWRLESQIRINEMYSGYTPPFAAARIVRKLLDPIPDEYVRGLDCIVLTNAAALSRRDRVGKVTTRGRRVSASRVCGRYHPQWNGRPAWIELYLDRILESWKSAPLWIPLVRELCLAETFYHELGHHVHLSVKPEFREKEDVADDYSKRFGAAYVKKRYWYLVPLFVLSGKTYHLFKRARRRAP